MPLKKLNAERLFSEGSYDILKMQLSKEGLCCRVKLVLLLSSVLPSGSLGTNVQASIYTALRASK